METAPALAPPALLTGARLLPTQRRALLVVVLTLVTGVTDAIGFTRLGGVFTSVMTGNMVLMGVAAGRAEALLALHVGVAFSAYVVGGFVGAHIAGSAQSGDGVWPPRVTLALGCELVVFALFAVAWEAARGAPHLGVTSLLIALNAAALGIQSSAVLRFGVTGLSTTYLTGTLTTVLGAAAARAPFATYRRSVAVLAALVGGSCLGAVVAVHLALLAPAFQLAPLAAVVAAGPTRLSGAGARR